MLDEDKFYFYKWQIDGENDVQLKAVSQNKSSGVPADVSSFGLNSTTKTNINGEFEKDVSFDYDHFELALADLRGSIRGNIRKSFRRYSFYYRVR